MRIIALNGSHRGERGYTHYLVRKVFEGATAAGAECEEITLAGLKINRCLACEKCVVDEEKRCVQDKVDDVRAILKKMEGADVIVFATPVYIQTMTGLMKTFLDRLLPTADVLSPRVTKSGLMFYETNRAICGKPLVALITCNNVEPEVPKNIVHYFKTYCKFNDAPLVGVLIRNAAYLTGQGKDLEAERRFPKILDVYEAYVQAGRELSAGGRITGRTQRRANQEIVPMPFFSVLKHFRPVKRKFIERGKSAVVAKMSAAQAEENGGAR
jgi:multimeric flavodoxin WrbA